MHKAQRQKFCEIEILIRMIIPLKFDFLDIFARKGELCVIMQKKNSGQGHLNKNIGFTFSYQDPNTEQSFLPRGDNIQVDRSLVCCVFFSQNFELLKFLPDETKKLTNQTKGSDELEQVKFRILFKQIYFSNFIQTIIQSVNLI